MGAPLSWTVPLLGVSRRPSTFSSVLLPDPEGPMTEMKLPGSTSRLMLESATVSSRSVR